MPRAAHIGDWLSLLILTSLWGSAFMFIELALTSFPPPVIVSGRIIIAAVVVYGYLRFTGRELPKTLKDWAPMMVIAVFGTVLPFNLIAWSQQYIDSSLAGVLMAVMPLFVLCLAHFFVPGGRMTPFRAAGFLMGFVGIVVVMGPNLSGGLSNNLGLWGALATLGAALSYAVSTIYTRSLGTGDPMRRAAGLLLVSCVLSAPAAIIEVPSLAAPSLTAVLALTFLGLLATGVATLLYFRLIQGPGPTFLSLVNFMVPVWAVLAGGIFLDESLSDSVFLGLSLILTGIAVSEFGAATLRRLVSLRVGHQVPPVAPCPRDKL